MRFSFPPSSAVRLLGVAMLATLGQPCRAEADVPGERACGRSTSAGTAGVEWEAGCVHVGAIRITRSGTTLDCRGGVLDGGGRLAVGIYIDSEGRELRDVTVRDCTLRNFRSNGVRVGWSGSDNDKGDDRREIYRRTPQHIVLERLRVQASGRVGIYLDDYTQDVAVLDSLIEGSGGAGIYLEHSSRGHRVVGNRIVDNGRSGRREGLAVDSSSDNVIEGNLFARNTAGGVFLYKNCGERLDDSAPRSTGQVVRWQPSDHNLIRRNRFEDEPVGVWLASRQSRDLSSLHCGDRPLDPARRFFEDFANDNEVVANTFCRTPVPVRNEGDRNRIVDNVHDASAPIAVQTPLTMRQRWAGRPPVGNVDEGNRLQPCALE